MKGEIFIAPEVKRKESKEKASIFTLSVYTIPLLFVVVSSSSVIDRKKHEKKSIAKKAFCKIYSLSRALSSFLSSSLHNSSVLSCRVTEFNFVFLPLYVILVSIILC